ncbi:MAG: ribonuclease III domain-containing protein [Desulfotomaculaceae bacterium]|nr:ribonuclease III domain-containing protein [Desulfotomaculaceae bacterium]
MYLNFKNNNIARPGDLPVLVLAYVGDAVYELAVREHLIGVGLVKVNKLHSETVKYVNAGAQAKALHALEGMFTEEEAAIVRRGRNARSPHTPRNAGMIEYRRSTALECLIGYLYLKGAAARLSEIMTAALEAINEEKND